MFAVNLIIENRKNSECVTIQKFSSKSYKKCLKIFAHSLKPFSDLSVNSAYGFYVNTYCSSNNVPPRWTRRGLLYYHTLQIINECVDNDCVCKIRIVNK